MKQPEAFQATEKRYFTAHEAAHYIGTHFGTMQRWAREGYVLAIPVGEGKRRLWRFLKSDLDAWMLSRRTGTVAEAGA